MSLKWNYNLNKGRQLWLYSIIFFKKLALDAYKKALKVWEQALYLPPNKRVTKESL